MNKSKKLVQVLRNENHCKRRRWGVGIASGEMKLKWNPLWNGKGMGISEKKILRERWRWKGSPS